MFKISKKLLTLICFINLVLSSWAETPVRKCANGLALPLSVQVDSCSEMPCELWRGYATNMAIQFVSPRKSVKDIKADVHMSTLAIGMPLELPSERLDVCKNLMFEANCPVYKGEDVTYHLVMGIGEYQPEVPAKIEVSIKDKSDDSILACFIVDARITRRSGLEKN